MSPRHSVAREFLVEPLLWVSACLIGGYLAAHLQHGFLPGSEQPFPFAGVRMPIWHIFWMGLWTGYAMALVGQASGVLALPYSMNIFQFTNVHVTPSMLVITLLNPIGALLGFKRTSQWNFAFAQWLCIGGALGAVCGPFIRLTLLSEANTFKYVVAGVSMFAGIQLLYHALRKKVTAGDFVGRLQQQVKTAKRAGAYILVSHEQHQWKVSIPVLLATGFGVAVISSAVGIGGGFLLAPLLVVVYRFPMFVLMGATMPYVIIQSAVGLLTFVAVMPLIGVASVAPEWAWALFASAGGILGSWFAVKTLRFFPERLLNFMLGAISAIAGALYLT